MIEVPAAQRFTAVAEDFAPGLEGIITVEIRGAAGSVVAAATAANIYDDPPGSGNYVKDDLVAPGVGGWYRVYWHDPGSGTDAMEDLRVTTDQVAMPEAQRGDRDFEVMQGDDYMQSVGHDIEFIEPTDGAWPDLTGAAVIFHAKSIQTPQPAFVKSGLIIAPLGPPKIVGVELPDVDTAAFDPGLHAYSIDATVLAPPQTLTLAKGRMRVIKKP